MAEDLSQAITDNALAGIKRAKGDSGEVEQHSLPDQIAADKYRRAVSATTGRKLGLRFAKVTAGGAS